MDHCPLDNILLLHAPLPSQEVWSPSCLFSASCLVPERRLQQQQGKRVSCSSKFRLPRSRRRLRRISTSSSTLARHESHPEHPLGNAVEPRCRARGGCHRHCPPAPIPHSYTDGHMPHLLVITTPGTKGPASGRAPRPVLLRRSFRGKGPRPRATARGEGRDRHGSRDAGQATGMTSPTARATCKRGCNGPVADLLSTGSWDTGVHRRSPRVGILGRFRACVEDPPDAALEIWEPRSAIAGADCWAWSQGGQPSTLALLGAWWRRGGVQGKVCSLRLEAVSEPAPSHDGLGQVLPCALQAGLQEPFKGCTQREPGSHHSEQVCCWPKGVGVC